MIVAAFDNMFVHVFAYIRARIFRYKFAEVTSTYNGGYNDTYAALCSVKTGGSDGRSAFGCNQLHPEAETISDGAG
jgi:hypothetical protein